jgi:hypothetical protein
MQIVELTPKLVKTGIVFFDYDARKVVPVPERFSLVFGSGQ